MSLTTMRVSTLAVLLALPSAAWTMQLPPDIQADRYLVRAQRQIEQQDYAGAKESMGRILELQVQHGLELPEEFFFRYAEVLGRLKLYDEVVEFATKYLTLAGREGEHYRAALELLDAVEQAKAAAEEAARRRAEAAKAAAEEAAEEARRRAEERRKVVGALVAGNEFVRIPAGEFRMGSKSAEADADEQPVRRVRINRAFEMGKYEVTQAEWESVMGTNPSYMPGCGRCPVENVSWEDVQEFIERLNAQAGEVRFRLPTESEWEYAARAGTAGDRYTDNLDAIAWYGGIGVANSGDRTHPVGQKAPNAFGLHDMLGNVSEWVEDWYGAYPRGSVTDPRGPETGSSRVVRGGDWFNHATACGAPDRYYHPPSFRGFTVGFRLVRTE